VVNRKVWGGSRTQTGAEAQSILMSVVRTCAQQHRDALTFLSRVLCGQRPRLLLAPV
jgi:transposase